ncbi:MAG: 4-hydroxy-3-methylbut-2-enyl diphosphate reductase [Bacteroidetes bacterium]|nr:4-hydroxy-3-methylbut-2-enyl diphosphate reductase [Bacteroidota bacterium]MDA1120070.1 4-hydroxy-3-methylbut-2-enyl diphosphate reductase [Bacteroidota bacterium]
MADKLNLSVDIDPGSGFCFGVVYAIEMAEDILDEEGHLYCLGDIVHNDQEVKRLEDKGLQIVSHDDLERIHDAKVLIRAHGEHPSTYELALKNNIELIDASCPVVLKLQNRVKNSHDEGRPIYIYGKHGHAEVKGLVGQTNDEAVVFQDISELEIDKLPSEITLYSQTTKRTDNLYNIRETLESYGVNVSFNDTICRQVSNRDKDLRFFAAKYKRIIFVSGTKSSNGKVLYNVCKETNPNTYFVTSKSEIESDWFNKNDTIGICGATSTPMWLMEEVKDQLLTY